MASFSFLLPFKFNDGRNIPPEFFTEVRDTLTAKYHGVTMQQNPDNPIKGLWISDDQKIMADDLMLFTVWAEDVNKARKYFREEYKPYLLEKFEQKEILIVEQTIEII